MAIPYKYIKEYVSDRRKTERKKSVTREDEEEKSIESIEADIDNFEVKLQ
jgi:hypothetical protein